MNMNNPRSMKRPGAMPPFALFSQEMRTKLQVLFLLWWFWGVTLFPQNDDPNIGFGDLGRKLGEMWHALEEPEKEDFRKRAR